MHVKKVFLKPCDLKMNWKYVMCRLNMQSSSYACQMRCCTLLAQQLQRRFHLKWDENVVFISQFGLSGLPKTWIKLVKFVFFFFFLFKTSPHLLLFSCLGECFNTALLWSSRNVFWMMKLHPIFHQHEMWVDTDWICVFGWIIPLISGPRKNSI